MRSERGFALIAALWLLVALSVIGLEFGIRAHARHTAVANALEVSRGTAAADAGIADVQSLLSRLARGTMLDPWAGCEQFLRDTVDLAGASYAVTLRDADASINLNRTSEDELRGLFVALRVDAGKADRLAQTIMDWEDGDDLHRARGAERDDYLRADAPVLPDNRPFGRLGDLRHVLGMTDEIYELVRPHLTLIGTGQINLNAAERPVILALQGVTEQAASVLIRRRDGSRPIRSLEELANELPTQPRAELRKNFAALSARTLFQTREIVATSRAWVEGSPVRVTIETLMARGGNRAFAVSRTVR